MKKIKGHKRFILIGFMLGLFLAGTTGVLALTYYASKDVSYDNSASGMTSENVQDAIDELYQLANAIDVNGAKIPTVTSGDGLYKDSYEENVYTYRGNNPNNYVTFNGETWRIVSINTNNETIKIIRSSVLSDMAYDTSNNGRFVSSSQYCNAISCNIYGSLNSLYDTNGNKITTLARPINGTAYMLPSKESEISTYLNGTYYNTLNSTAKNMIVNGDYKAAILDSTTFSQTNISTQIGNIKKAIWKGKVGLLDATEYMRATTGSSVSSDNWLHIGDAYWTMSGRSINASNLVWVIHSDGDIWYLNSSNSYGVRPVLTLSADVKIKSGNGTSGAPYQLS